MNNFKKYLHTNFTFSEDELKRLLTCFTSKILRKKEHFLKAGQFCKNVAFIEKGCFMYYELIDGEEKVCDDPEMESEIQEAVFQVVSKFMRRGRPTTRQGPGSRQPSRN